MYLAQFQRRAASLSNLNSFNPHSGLTAAIHHETGMFNVLLLLLLFIETSPRSQKHFPCKLGSILLTASIHVPKFFHRSWNCVNEPVTDLHVEVTHAKGHLKNPLLEPSPEGKKEGGKERRRQRERRGKKKKNEQLFFRVCHSAQL